MRWVMIRRVSSAALLICAGTLLLAAPGCAPAPRVRPVKEGPVDTGSGTLTAARKYLEGTWTLVSFELFPPKTAA